LHDGNAGALRSPENAWAQQRKFVVHVDDVWRKGADSLLHRRIAAEGPNGAKTGGGEPQGTGAFKVSCGNAQELHRMAIFAEHFCFKMHDGSSTAVAAVFVVDLQDAGKTVHCKVLKKSASACKIEPSRGESSCSRFPEYAKPAFSRMAWISANEPCLS